MGLSYYQGIYDYLHLGVLYLKLQQPNLALKAFKKQSEFNEVSEVHFYSAQAHFQLGNEAKAIDLLNQALQFYNKGLKMYDPYRQLPNEIYSSDIEQELEAVSKD